MTERNTTSAVSAGLPAHPGTCSKNPIPVCLSNATCVKTIRQEEPKCVQRCLNDVLTYEEREEEVEEEVEIEEVETGLTSMIDKYGYGEGNGYHCPDVKKGLTP